MSNSILLSLVGISLFIAEAKAYHFVCHDKLPQGISKNPTALLVPYEADVTDKAGAVFSLISDPETMTSSKDIPVVFKGKSHNPFKPSLILEGTAPGNSIALKLSAKGMVRNLTMKNLSTSERHDYRCFAESSI
jgi:hypothetical protein